MSSDEPQNPNTPAPREFREETPFLRVANIIEESRYGGPQRRIALVAERLRDHGIETTVICARMGSDRFREDLKARGVSCRTLRLHRITRNPPELLLAILFFPYETLRLALLFRRERFDLVHCNGSWQWKGVLAGWLTRTPVIWHLNDTNVPGVIHLVFRRLAKIAAGFIVAGERVRRYYLSTTALSAKPVFEIQAPVDCERFTQPDDGKDPDIASLPGVKVLTIANINPAKGLETLVRVAARLKDQTEPPISFAVVGQSLRSQEKYRRNLLALQKHLGATNVHFLGPRTDIPACLRASDIGLCCSVAEASPMAVWETAAAGLPVVATDVGDIELLNKKWRFAYTTAVCDVNALTKAIHALHSDSAKSDQMGKNGRRMALKVFGLEVCATLHAKAYSNIKRRNI